MDAYSMHMLQSVCFQTYDHGKLLINSQTAETRHGIICIFTLSLFTSTFHLVENLHTHRYSAYFAAH